MHFKGVDLKFILANCFLPSSKYFLTALGHVGLNNLLAAYEDKSAVAVCTFAFCAGPGEEPILFQGRTEGGLSPLVDRQISDGTQYLKLMGGRMLKWRRVRR